MYKYRLKIKLFIFVNLIAAVLLLNACGIDTITFLDIKIDVPSSTEQAFVFIIPVSSSENYLGVNIFYKIYSSISQAETDRAALKNRQTALDTMPGSYIQSFLLSKTALNYSAISYKDGSNFISPIPLIEKSFAGKYCSVSFLDSEKAVMQQIVNEEKEIYRASGLGGNMSFYDTLKEGDEDYAGGVLENSEYYIQFFAAAYGLDFSNITEIYGDAFYLGLIRISNN